MTSEVLVVDVSRDWAIACEVQQRFMQGLDRASDTLDYGARCRQMRALGGDCYDFVPIPDNRLAMVLSSVCNRGPHMPILNSGRIRELVGEGRLIRYGLRDNDGYRITEGEYS